MRHETDRTDIVCILSTRDFSGAISNADRPIWVDDEHRRGRDGATGADTQSIARLDPNTLQRLDGYQVVTTSHDSNSDFGRSPTRLQRHARQRVDPNGRSLQQEWLLLRVELNPLAAGSVSKLKLAGHHDSTSDCDAISDGTYLYVGGPRAR